MVGYLSHQVPFVPVDINVLGVQNLLTTKTTHYFAVGQKISDAIDLGFEFLFYGVNYSTVYVSPNGYIQFNETTTWRPRLVPPAKKELLTLSKTTAII